MPITTTDQNEVKEAEASRVLRAIKEEIAKINEEHTNLMNSTNSAQLAYEELERSVKALELKKDKLEAELEALANQRKTEESVVSEVKTEVKANKKTEKDTKKAVEELENQKKTLKATLAEEEAVLRASMNEQLAELSTRLKEVEDARVKALADLEKIVATTTKTEEDLASKKAELAQIKKDIKENSAELAVVEKNLGKAMNTQLEAENALGAANLAKEQVYTDLKDTRNTISTLQKETDALKAGIKELEVAKTETQALYETEKTKLFAITQREDHVKQQEIYVKSLFEKAGVPYPEFNPE